MGLKAQQGSTLVEASKWPGALTSIMIPSNFLDKQLCQAKFVMVPKEATYY